MAIANKQLTLKLARAGRDAGIARAMGHADRVNGDWSERAFVAMRSRLGYMERFTCEDMREACSEIQTPPDARAWGGIMLRAARAGFIVQDGWTIARAANVHCSPARVWRSILFRPSGRVG